MIYYVSNRKTSDGIQQYTDREEMLNKMMENGDIDKQLLIVARRPNNKQNAILEFKRVSGKLWLTVSQINILGYMFDGEIEETRDAVSSKITEYEV